MKVLRWFEFVWKRRWNKYYRKDAEAFFVVFGLGGTDDKEDDSPELLDVAHSPGIH